MAAANFLYTRILFSTKTTYMIIYTKCHRRCNLPTAGKADLYLLTWYVYRLAIIARAGDKYKYIYYLYEYTHTKPRGSLCALLW